MSQTPYLDAWIREKTAARKEVRRAIDAAEELLPGFSKRVRQAHGRIPTHEMFESVGLTPGMMRKELQSREALGDLYAESAVGDLPPFLQVRKQGLEEALEETPRTLRSLSEQQIEEYRPRLSTQQEFLKREGPPVDPMTTRVRDPKQLSDDDRQLLERLRVKRYGEPEAPLFDPETKRLNPNSLFQRLPDPPEWLSGAAEQAVPAGQAGFLGLRHGLLSRRLAPLEQLYFSRGGKVPPRMENQANILVGKMNDLRRSYQDIPATDLATRIGNIGDTAGWYAPEIALGTGTTGILGHALLSGDE